MKRIDLTLVALVLSSLALSCSSYKSPSTSSTGSTTSGSGSSSSTSTSSKGATSGLTFRAFISQDVQLPVSPTFPAGVTPGLFIVDATQDVRSTVVINTNNTAGRMILAPNKSVTLVLGTEDNIVSVVNNQQESVTGAIPLPAFSESIALSPNGAVGYAAVSNAPMPGQAPGAIEVLNLSASTPAISATLSLPAAHYVVSSHNGNRLLVFSDNSDTATLVYPSNIGTVQTITTGIGGFDRPLYAFFSADDSTAWVLNCGPECGGNEASIQEVDLNTNTLAGAPIPVAAASVGLLQGTTLYVAGTPPTAPANSCAGANTAATTCGRLSIVDVNAKKVIGSAIITDGYHARLSLSDNGQLFIGSRNCTNISISGGETRGCLSIYNTLNGNLVVPPQNGDATGIQAIAKRNICYVVQNNQFFIYDTTIDALRPGIDQIPFAGQLIDVITPDF